MTAEPLTMLYVDDDKDIRRIVSLAVSLDSDMSLRTAASGAEALQLLEGGDWRPDVVMLDVMMPGMSGPATMAAMRSDQAYADTPFIFITAMGRAADVDSYRALGVAGTIVKPFDPISLPQRIRALTAAWRGAR